MEHSELRDGRIYLIKGMLENGYANATAREHLDLCPTCRACETTCRSGVRYGELTEIGSELLEEQLANRRLAARPVAARGTQAAPFRAVDGPWRPRPVPSAESRATLVAAPTETAPLHTTGRVLLWQGLRLACRNPK